MRIAVAGFGQETGSFLSLPATLDDFKQFGIHEGQEVLEKCRGVGVIGGFLAAAEIVAFLLLVSDLALSKMNITAYGFEFRTSKRNGTLVGYLGQMPYDGNDTHTAFYLSMQDSLKPFYNPGITGNNE
jgi:hypothetical protein